MLSTFTQEIWLNVNDEIFLKVLRVRVKRFFKLSKIQIYYSESHHKYDPINVTISLNSVLEENSTYSHSKNWLLVFVCR